MLFGINNFKLTLLLMLIVSLTACAQSQQVKLEQSRQFEKKALELRLKKDFRGALREQLKAIELNEDAQGLTILAGIYQEIHETENVPEYFQKSKDVLEKAVKLDPNDAVAHSMLADVLSQIGDKQGAIREQKEAVRLNPKNLNSLTTLGVWQHNANDVSAARKTYEEVLKINPNYIYALLRYGLLENEAGNVDNAKRLFIRATDAPRTEQLDESFAKRAKAELQKMDGEIK